MVATGLEIQCLTFVQVVQIPGNVLAPKSRRRVIYVDAGAGGAQRQALLDAWQGRLGGPLADLNGLIGQEVAVYDAPNRPPRRARLEGEQPWPPSCSRTSRSGPDSQRLPSRATWRCTGSSTRGRGSARGRRSSLAAAGLYQLTPLRDALPRECRHLMLVMFGVGVAHLDWMGVLALIVLVEKTASLGERLVRPLGAAFIALALVALLRPGSMPGL